MHTWQFAQTLTSINIIHESIWSMVLNPLLANLIKKRKIRAHMKEWNNITIWTPRLLGLPIMEIYGVDWGHRRTKFVIKGSHHLSQSWNATSSTKWLWAKKLQHWCWIVQREAGKCHIAMVQVPWPLSYDLWAPTTTRRLCGLTLLDHNGPSPYVC